MKNKITTWSTYILSSLLSLLGFSSCEKVGGGAVEYGAPYVSFQIKGTVTNHQAYPIPNTQIIINYPYSKADTLLTKLDGTYSLTTSYTQPTDSITVTAQDIDGTINGLYTPQTKKVPTCLNNTDAQNWYKGEVRAEANFVMDPIQEP